MADETDDLRDAEGEEDSEVAAERNCTTRRTHSMRFWWGGWSRCHRRLRREFCGCVSLFDLIGEVWRVSWLILLRLVGGEFGQRGEMGFYAFEQMGICSTHSNYLENKVIPESFVTIAIPYLQAPSLCCRVLGRYRYLSD